MPTKKTKLRNIGSKLVKFTSRAYRKKVIVLPSRDYMYKIAWGPSTDLLVNEHIAQDHVEGSIWDGISCFQKPVFVAPYNALSIHRAKKLPRLASSAECLELIENLIQHTKKQNWPMQPWFNTLEPNCFQRFWDALPKEAQQLIDRVLHGSLLPVTSCHGDLIEGNILADENDHIKIIDWEYFRKHGSIVTDIARLHIFYLKSNINSQEASQFNPHLLERYLPVTLFQSRFGLSKQQLSFIGAISNVCLPVAAGNTERRTDRFLRYIL